MASMLSSQGMVLATAMAVSGTVILLAFRLQKSLDQIPQPSQQVLRSCISSEGKKKKKKTEKKVHFAEDVMDPRSDGAEFRKQLKSRVRINNSAASALNSTPKFKKFGGGKDRGIPANRVALYNGILRDRVVQRLAYSY